MVLFVRTQIFTEVLRWHFLLAGLQLTAWDVYTIIEVAVTLNKHKWKSKMKWEPQSKRSLQTNNSLTAGFILVIWHWSISSRVPENTLHSSYLSHMPIAQVRRRHGRGRKIRLFLKQILIKSLVLMTRIIFITKISVTLTMFCLASYQKRGQTGISHCFLRTQKECYENMNTDCRTLLFSIY